MATKGENPSEQNVNDPGPKKSDIEQYRLSEMLKMGFTKYQSHILLTLPGFYVADIREKFLRHGCSPEMVWRILRP